MKRRLRLPVKGCRNAIEMGESDLENSAPADRPQHQLRVLYPKTLSLSTSLSPHVPRMAYMALSEQPRLSVGAHSGRLGRLERLHPLLHPRISARDQRQPEGTSRPAQAR